jgi:hypothetical protein
MMITVLVVCVLFDAFTPFIVDGAFYLQLVNDSVEMNAPAPPADEQTPAVGGTHVVGVVVHTVQVFLPDGPVSARTPAARPPPSL